LDSKLEWQGGGSKPNGQTAGFYRSLAGFYRNLLFSMLKIFRLGKNNTDSGKLIYSYFTLKKTVGWIGIILHFVLMSGLNLVSGLKPRLLWLLAFPGSPRVGRCCRINKHESRSCNPLILNCRMHFHAYM